MTKRGRPHFAHHLGCWGNQRGDGVVKEDASPKKPNIFGAREEGCRNAEARNFESNLLCHTPVACPAESASKKPYLVDILIIRDMTYHDGGGGMPREGGAILGFRMT